MHRSLDRAMVLMETDDETGSGWLRVHPDASDADIRAGLALVKDAGYEVLSALETGDEYDEDDQERSMIPLAKKWDSMKGD